jgi:hypothetical protein
MFEDIIMEIEALGLEYTEDYEAGTLTVNIAAADKTDIINVVSILTSMDIDFTIDEASIVVMDMVMEDMPEEEDATTDEDYQDAALEDMFGAV